MPFVFPSSETTDTNLSSPATTPTEETSVTPTASSTTNASEETTSVTPTANSTTNATEGNITTTTVTPAATTTTKPSSDPCNTNPCGTNSAKCISLFSDYVCECPYGFYYDSSTCYPGKIFPGTITLAGTYSKDIETVNSSQYQEMSEKLTAFFEAAFNLTDYKQTVIVKVDVTTGNTRSENSGVSITVMNIFEKNTKETTETVTNLIREEANRSNSAYLYSNTSHCAVFDCDSATTECQESEYPECKCKNGLSKTEWDDRSCSDCSSDCSANNNKYCAKTNGVPECYCMTNFKREDEKCVSCPVGYSGQNCENNFELILIIVGTVFGAIILCLVVAVSVVSVRAKHSKDPEKKSLIKPGHSNPDTSSETRIFPRIQTTSGHGNPGYQPNPYEARSSNRNRFLDGDYDDVYDMSREPEGFRMQRR
ncbi:mucin-13 isoform X6 [Anas acuta]|uniref:mucin-13 isoform X6 n=1 Tax=Anas acuta TaxID=28680 RepID=UPI0035C921E9